MRRPVKGVHLRPLGPPGVVVHADRGVTRGLSAADRRHRVPDRGERQFLVRGREVIHWTPLATLSTVTLPYDEAKDAGLFAAAAHMVPVRLAAGQFAILLPDDAHAPCCAWDDPEDVIKVVVKVAV